MTVHKLADLRAGDLMIFLSVARCQSVNGAARELNLSASQVSKAVARLEEQLGVSLMVRSTRGITISDAGNRILPQLTDLVQRVQDLDRREGLDAAIAVAAPSYVISWCAPRIAEALPGGRIRAIEMAPALIRTLAASNFFDVCITLAEERLPESWVNTHVGVMRRSCFGTPALYESLGPPPIPVDVIRAVPFVLPVYNANGVYVPVDDGCPLAASQRTAGHEAQTMALALEIASVTQQLVFGPLMAVSPFLADGRMVEFEIEGWNERDPVYVACNVDRVRATQQRHIAEAVRASLESLGSSNRASSRNLLPS
ncbi:MAG: LysR family transcriptional regulator [Deltaproteobacteria bacterium]|nr:LysR family transcriptional regulator [Deltaproteobacteria bacterium]